MTIKTMAQAAQEHKDWAQGTHARIPLGFPIIDDLTRGGPAPGQLLMFACYSGVGKTTWGVNVAVNCRHVPTLFISLEMDARSILQRLAAVDAETPTSKIEGDVESHGRSAAIESFVTRFPLLVINDEPSVSIRGIENTIDEASTQVGETIKLVVIDYMEMIAGTGIGKDSNSNIEDISRGLKKLARKKDVVVIILHQCNATAGEGFEPLSRRSIKYQADVPADYTMAAYRKHLDPSLTYDQIEEYRSEFHIQFLKTRGGSRTHPFGLRHGYNSESMKIYPPASQLAPEFRPWSQPEITGF